MKYFMMLMAAALMATACASPKEKYDDQRMEAKKEYKEELKQAQDEYQGDSSELRKERAKEMVEDSRDVDVDIDDNEIDLQD